MISSYEHGRGRERFEERGSVLANEAILLFSAPSSPIVLVLVVVLVIGLDRCWFEAGYDEEKAGPIKVFNR
jgi:hypothetical protein